MVKTAAYCFHAINHVQVVAISMHVPHACVACVDGHVTAARLAQAPRLQQQFADGVGLCIVVTGPSATHLVPALAAGVLAGVVHRHRPGVFL